MKISLVGLGEGGTVVVAVGLGEGGTVVAVGLEVGGTMVVGLVYCLLFEECVPLKTLRFSL